MGILILAFLSVFFLPLCPARAGGSPPGDPVTLTFQEKQGHFDITGHFTVLADPDVVWDGLTDFGRYSQFSHELKKVTVTSLSPNHLTVEEMAESGVLFFTQKVYFTLDIHLEPGKSIISEDVAHKSFVSYRSQWDLQSSGEGNGVDLTYHLMAEGHFGAPAFMVNDGFKGGIKSFLESMREEILRRQAKKIAAGVAPAPGSRP